MPRTRLLPPLIAAWFIAVLLAYHFGPEPFPPGGLASILLDLILLTTIGGAAWGLGAMIAAPLRLREASPEEAPLFEIGLGLGGLALIVFALAAARILYRPVVIAVVAIGVALLALVATKRRLPAPGPPRPWSRAEWGMLALPLFAGAASLAASLAPPEFYDALIYHLAVPEQYLRHHAMVPIPGNYYAQYPANMGMLYAVGLALGGGGLAQSIHWLCGALSAAILFASARRHADRPTAILACAIFCLTPGILISSTWAIADLGVTLFAAICFSAVMNLWGGGDRRWLVAAGVAAGLALGTKYTAALVVCAPAAAAVALRPGPRGRALRDAAILSGLALLVVSPWLVRNIVLNGNPVAPYFTAITPAGDESHPDIAQEIARRLPREEGAGALVAHYALAPWRATMTRLGQGGYLGPIFLMLIPALLFLKGLPRGALPATLMTAVGCAAWAVSSQVVRYLFPLLPLAALLAAIAARRLPKWIVLPAVGWSLAYNSLLFAVLIQTIGPLRAVTGAEPPRDYLDRRVSYHAAMVWLEDLAPPEAKVLFVGEGRTYYCPRECVAATPFDAPVLDGYAARSGSERELAASLKRDGITHLLVSDPELRRTKQTTADDVMRRFFPSGSPRLQFERNGVRIYDLP